MARMSHVNHIATNKEVLLERFQILRLIREWFWSQGFTEVEAPHIVRLPGQEPYLSPMKIDIHNERGETYTGHLHTSPEYLMKKMLAAGFDNIFCLGKVFRDHESFGGTHNPEFTMIEWYRANKDFWSLMTDCEQLIQFILKKVGHPSWFSQVKKIHMRDLWQEYVGINLDDYLTREAMYDLCVTRGFAPLPSESYEDLFFRIFLNDIENKLPIGTPTIVHHYPLPMAALSKASEKERGYAERFELYWGGVELANAFTELTDATEQRRRLIEEQQFRGKTEKPVFAIDEEFIAAVEQMPPATGIALGVDRLVQVITGCKNIDKVLPLPASILFS